MKPHGKSIAFCLTLGFWAFATSGASAVSFKTLHSFRGGSDGEFPAAGVFNDGSGNFYGTTFGGFGDGGTPGKHCAKSCGNVFGYRAGDGETPLYSFNGAGDGAFPAAEVTTQNGIIYGTTEYGPGSGCGGLGCGTVFAIPPDGGKALLFSFCKLPSCGSGVFPHSGLTPDGQGNFYGMTLFGGAGLGRYCASSLGGCGVVFKISANLKTETVLYSFCLQPGCTDGAVPSGNLLLLNGNLFGTTQFGGAYSAGTAFELTPNGRGGWDERVLYSFCPGSEINCPDGSVPEAGLAADNAGNLYGTTTYGGGYDCPGGLGCGAIFEIADPNGANIFSPLYAFKGIGAGDGAIPQAPVVVAGSQGNVTLYGTTLRGGSGTCGGQGCGTVFVLTQGDEHPLYSFTGKKDGAHPQGALSFDTASQTLYGVARVDGGGTCRCGTLYSLNLQTMLRH